jgi:Uma2 family endonuclease
MPAAGYAYAIFFRYKSPGCYCNSGAIASAEVRIPILRVSKVKGLLQIGLFIDFGIAWNYKASTLGLITLPFSFTGGVTMTVASIKMSIEEYLNFDDDTDTRYELENGELIVMPPESDLNQRIASLLFALFLQQGIPPYRLRIGAEIVVNGSRATTRLPDLMVLSEELATALEGACRSTITIDMPPPLLVVEVVSPRQENRDYRYKRSEYGARGILE